MHNWASWDSDESGPSTLQGLSSQTDQSTQFTYLSKNNTEGSDYTQRLMEHNQITPTGNAIRNPDESSRGKIVLARERDVHGKISLTHSYTDNGKIFHRQHSMDRTELKAFLTKYPDLHIITEGDDQILHCGSDTYVQVDKTQPSPSFSPPSLMAPVASATRGSANTPSLGSCFGEGNIIASNDRDYARYCTNVGNNDSAPTCTTGG
jgi:hypothetical protein